MVCFYSLLRESGSVTTGLILAGGAWLTFLFAVTRERVSDPKTHNEKPANQTFLFAVTRERVSDSTSSVRRAPSSSFYSLLRESGSVTSPRSRE